MTVKTISNTLMASLKFFAKVELTDGNITVTGRGWDFCKETAYKKALENARDNFPVY